jgi:hypothetical protein
MFDGNLLGDGGARNAAGCGLGATFLAGEKCCWRVENAGLPSCGSTDVDAGAGFRSCVALGGRRAVLVLSVVLDDFVREWLETRVLADREFAEAFRRCRG